jgi:hypothetical protein
MGWAPFVAQCDSAGLTTASTAYTAGDQLGTEMTLAAVSGADAGYGVINAVTLIDDGDILGGVEVWIFSDATAEAADNAAAAWSDADAVLIVPGMPIYIPAPVDVGGVRLASITNLWVPYKSGSGHDDLFVDLVTRSGHTFFTAADDLHLRFSGMKYT